MKIVSEETNTITKKKIVVTDKDIQEYLESLFVGHEAHIQNTVWNSLNPTIVLQNIKFQLLFAIEIERNKILDILTSQYEGRVVKIKEGIRQPDNLFPFYITREVVSVTEN